MREYRIENTDAVLRYHDLQGEGTPILFIHGLGCSGSFDYPEVAASGALVSHRRILIDLLGAGFSDRPQEFPYTAKAHAKVLAGLVDALKLDKFIVFGHSLGGAVAIELAALLEDRITYLVLSESNMDPSGPNSLSRAIASYTLEDFIDRGHGVLIQDSMLNGNAMWAASMRLWRPEALYRLSENAVQGGNPSWRETFYGLRCKKAFLFGEHSLPDPDEQALSEQGIPIEIVKDAGHSMAWEQPELVAAAIHRAIAE